LEGKRKQRPNCLDCVLPCVEARQQSVTICLFLLCNKQVKSEQELVIEPEERREMLRIFLHIIKSVELEVVRFWWKNIVKKEQEALLQLLQV
jgi:hypothetical protein